MPYRRVALAIGDRSTQMQSDLKAGGVMISQVLDARVVPHAGSRSGAAS
jgi:hypothetical protein